MCGAPWANDWDNVGSMDFFSTCGFHVLVNGNYIEIKDKTTLPCFREVKCLNGLKLCLAGNFQSHI